MHNCNNIILEIINFWKTIHIMTYLSFKRLYIILFDVVPLYCYSGVC